MKKLIEILQSRKEILEPIASGLGFCNPRLYYVEGNQGFNLVVDLINNDTNAIDNQGVLQALLMKEYDCQVNIFITQTIKPLYRRSLLENTAKLDDNFGIEKLFKMSVSTLTFSDIESDVDQDSLDELVSIGKSLLQKHQYSAPYLDNPSSFWNSSSVSAEKSEKATFIPFTPPAKQLVIPADCLEKLIPFTKQQVLSSEQWHALQGNLETLINAAQPLSSESKEKPQVKSIITPVK